jgi:hypothetical protein
MRGFVAILLMSVALVGTIAITLVDRGEANDNWIDQNDDDFEFAIRIFLSYADDGTDRMRYHMNSAYLWSAYLEEGGCVDSMALQVVPMLGSGIAGGFHSIVDMDGPICDNGANNEYSGDIPMPWVDAYYYPYDVSRWLVKADFSDERDGEYVAVRNFINWTIDAPGRQVKMELIDMGVSHAVVLELRRPLVYRVLTPVIIVTMLVFIFYIPFIASTEAFLEITIGLFFGLWSARQILLIPSVQTPTILDPIFLALYVLTALAIVIRATITMNQGPIRLPGFILRLSKRRAAVKRTDEQLLAELLDDKDGSGR